ncbi:MAG: SDR family NAD(P)-dependent oxidoreductase [Cohaesibacter sp.]|nr:SDR family NAD(P)-dependent oxidoreductase [Cohaesibacter sp.]
MSLNIAVIGSSGAIGTAMTNCLAARYKTASIHAFSRGEQGSAIAGVHYHGIDYQEEASIKQAAKRAAQDKPLDLVFVAIGQLHDGDILPEKSLRDISERNFQHLFQSNAIIPALLAKHFLPELNRQNRSVFAALSARVGSISDNRLGGWYAYRASKAALNMIIKNAAIETARRNKQAIIVGLHPGTVDSDLSKPFQKAVPDGKLFTPDFSAQKLLTIMQKLTPDQSGKCFAWDGQEIAP